MEAERTAAVSEQGGRQTVTTSRTRVSRHRLPFEMQMWNAERQERRDEDENTCKCDGRAVAAK